MLPQPYELDRAVPPTGLVTPEVQTCVEANDEERQLIRIAVDVLEIPSARSGFLSIGAHRLLANGLYRSGENPGRVCDPVDLFERASQLIANSDHLRRGRLTEYGIKLIAKLPNPSEDIVEQLAGSAFATVAQESELFRRRDIRPLARAALASLGERARPYAEKAAAQMSISDALGTGAAQIAVAGRFPGALARVERLMANQMKFLPSHRPVPWDIRNRLYEMAIALQMGGEEARQHTSPLIDLMRRKVQSWAPPFGMIELPPRRMCLSLATIRGTPKSSLEFSYCSDDSAPLEQ